MTGEETTIDFLSVHVLVKLRKRGYISSDEMKLICGFKLLGLKNNFSQIVKKACCGLQEPDLKSKSRISNINSSSTSIVVETPLNRSGIKVKTAPASAAALKAVANFSRTAFLVFSGQLTAKSSNPKVNVP